VAVAAAAASAALPAAQPEAPQAVVITPAMAVSSPDEGGSPAMRS
jgi:hypothetical protein